MPYTDQILYTYKKRSMPPNSQAFSPRPPSQSQKETYHHIRIKFVAKGILILIRFLFFFFFFFVPWMFNSQAPDV